MIDFQVRSEGDESLPDDYGADLPGVSAARRDAEHHCLSVAEPHVVIPALLSKLQTDGHELTSLSTRQATLEDVFVHLTGRRLDDEEDPS